MFSKVISMPWLDYFLPRDLNSIGDEVEAVRTRLRLLTTLGMVFMGFIYTSFYLWLDLGDLGWLQTMVMVPAVLVGLMFARVDRQQTLAHSAVFLLLLSCHLSGLYFMGTSTPGMLWFLLPAFSALALLGRRGMITWMVICVATFLAHLGLEVFAGMVAPSPAHALTPFKLQTITVATCFTIMCAMTSTWIGMHAAQIARQRKEAAQADSRAKSLFLTTVSHELRAPLDHIDADVARMSTSLGDFKDIENEFIQEDLQNIRLASAHLQDLISNILDTAAIEYGQRELHIETFEVTTLASALEEAIEERLERQGLRFEIDLGDTSNLELTTDLGILERILINLLDNAIKFTPEGVVTLRVRETASDQITIDIEDTGIGIDAKKQELLFEAFTQIESGYTRSRDGAGLGLAVCARFGDLLGATLSVESAPGEGSTFSLTLPRENKQRDARTQGPNPTDVKNGRARGALEHVSTKLWAPASLLERLLPPSYDSLGEIEAVTVATRAWLLFLLSPLFALLAIAHLVIGLPQCAAIQFASASVAAIASFGLRRGWSPSVCGHVGVASFVLATTAPLWLANGTDHPGYMWLTSFFLPALLLTNRRGAIFWAALGVAMFVPMFGAAQWYGWGVAPPPTLILPLKLINMTLWGFILLFYGIGSEVVGVYAARLAGERKEAAQSANEAKSLFLATMSHELRTPLNAIIGYAELVEEELEEEGLAKHVQEELDDIGASAQELLAIISDVLDVTHIRE